MTGFHVAPGAQTSHALFFVDALHDLLWQKMLPVSLVPLVAFLSNAFPPLQVLLHMLFEHAAGYALFAVKEVEEIGMLLPQVGLLFLFSIFFWLNLNAELTVGLCVQVEESVLSIGKFNSMVSLAAFFPFKSAQTALENMNAISEGKCAPPTYFSSLTGAPQL